MSNYKVNIVPVQAFTEKANCVIIQPGQFGPPPSFNVLVGVLIQGKDEVPAKGTPGHEGYTPAVSAVADQFTPQKQQMVELTETEWNSWDNKLPDEVFVRNLVLSKLGYTLAK